MKQLVLQSINLVHIVTIQMDKIDKIRSIRLDEWRAEIQASIDNMTKSELYEAVEYGRWLYKIERKMVTIERRIKNDAGDKGST